MAKTWGATSLNPSGLSESHPRYFASQKRMSTQSSDLRESKEPNQRLEEPGNHTWA